MAIDPEALAQSLRQHPSIRGKLAIGGATGALGLAATSIGRPGDDAAVLENAAGGYDLLAGEGFIPAFVKDDPWFAGWCGVMVNLSDIAAMGGWAVALIDQVWAPSPEAAKPLLDGLKAASEAYGVPIVGGHTNFGAPELGLAVSVLGRSRALVTSFDAKPGDALMIAVDMRGEYRNYDNFCAALDVPAKQLRGDLALVSDLAERRFFRAGKDISQGGIAGTALMLAEASGVGIALDLDRVWMPYPPGSISLERWMRSFPSFGFLFSIKPDKVQRAAELFLERSIFAGAIGKVERSSRVTFHSGQSSAVFWDWRETPYLRPAAPSSEAHHA
ncbi:sll0787 family AIR synthase-like protein [Jiella sp. KSK16Y-1]|uniref:Sll0787 family AIR synthase-like protein n=2 Tax=Jiella mangrovi TaxID=2821407 RepID=A0ABS4BFZ9_9HYPH|nr:sll0787 family AIR synthase-like protein [Jiella mangrovi]MBP0615672.1 sll0787 family AIR synthase-like protein [Jiella mangrovi]